MLTRRKWIGFILVALLFLAAATPCSAHLDYPGAGSHPCFLIGKDTTNLLFAPYNTFSLDEDSADTAHDSPTWTYRYEPDSEHPYVLTLHNGFSDTLAIYQNEQEFHIEIDSDADVTITRYYAYQNLQTFENGQMYSIICAPSCPVSVGGEGRLTIESVEGYVTVPLIVGGGADVTINDSVELQWAARLHVEDGTLTVNGNSESPALFGHDFDAYDDAEETGVCSYVYVDDLLGGSLILNGNGEPAAVFRMYPDNYVAHLSDDDTDIAARVTGLEIQNSRALADDGTELALGTYVHDSSSASYTTLYKADGSVAAWARIVNMEHEAQERLVTLTFADAQGNQVEKSAPAGKPYTLPDGESLDLHAEGGAYDLWNYESRDLPAGSLFFPAFDTTLTAVFTPYSSFYVTLDLQNDNTFSSWCYQGLFAPEYPYCEGKDFVGWFTEPEGGEEVLAGTYFTEKADLTLYAHWKDSDPNETVHTLRGTGLTWTINNGELRISGSGDLPDFWSPWSDYGGGPWKPYLDTITSVVLDDGVTGVGDYAFSDAQKLTTARLPAGLTRIGENAFDRNTLLREIELPASLTEIGRSAFGRCTSLLSFTLAEGNSVYSLRDGVLYSKDGKELALLPAGLESYTVPEGVTRIGDYACYYVGLKSIQLPSTLTVIGQAAFFNAWRLGGVRIPDSVTELGRSAFYYSGLSELSIGASLQAINDSVFAYCQALRSVTIPNNITAIGSSSFANCSNLTTLTVGTGLKSVGRDAFSGCDALSDIYYDGSQSDWDAITIASGNDKFASLAPRITIRCGESLTAELGDDGVLTISGTGPMWDFDYSSVPWTAERNKITRVVVHDGVTRIGSYAFYYAANLEEVSFGNTVTSIGESAFSSCTKLSGLTLPDSVTAIGNNAFNYCPMMANASFGKGLETIGNYAFSSCSGLTTLTIPDSVTTIQYNAFDNCTGLTEATLGSGLTSIGIYQQKDVGGGGAVVLMDAAGAGGSGAGGSSAGGSGGGSSGGSYDADVYGDIFRGCSRLTAIHVHADNPAYLDVDGVLFTRADAELLHYPAGRQDTTYTVPAGTVSIRNEAFYGSAFLTEIEVPGSVTAIGESAFSSCASLAVVRLSSGLLHLGGYAFSNCRKLSEINIPDSVTTIGGSAFSGCSALPELTIGSGVTYIGDAICYNAAALTAIRVHADNPAYADRDGVLFSKSGTVLLQYPIGKTGASYEVPDGVRTIAYGAFAYNKLLTDVSLPLSVTTIKENAFFRCSSTLKTIHYVGCADAWDRVSVEKSEYSWGSPFSYAKIVCADHEMLHIPAAEATCAEDGCFEHWACAYCGKYFVQEGEAYSETAAENVIIHVPHKLVKVEAVAAAEYTDGVREHWTCTVCDALFADSEGAVALDAADVVLLAPKTAGSMGDLAEIAWEYDRQTREFRVLSASIDPSDMLYLVCYRSNGQLARLCAYTDSSVLTLDEDCDTVQLFWLTENSIPRCKHGECHAAD